MDREALIGRQLGDARPSDKEIADWVVATCLTFGASVATAYQVAGMFVLSVSRVSDGS